MSSLGSEEEDKVGLLSLGPPDCQEGPDKTSLTPSEGTEEAGSPALSTQPHSLSPGGRNGCAQAESGAKAREDTAYISTDGGQESLRMYCKSLTEVVLLCLEILQISREAVLHAKNQNLAKTAAKTICMSNEIVDSGVYVNKFVLFFSDAT